MEKTLYMAAMEGNVDVLREVRDREIENGCWDNFIQSLTPQKNNIVHIACQYDQLEFLRNGFDFMIFTHHLISQRNANGDTPIHVASKRGNKDIVKLLVEISKKFVLREVLISSEVVEEIVHEEEPPKWAFRIANSMGNTPLHQALINGKLEVAKYLIDADPHVATLVNNHRETPLHLAIKYNVDGEKKFAIDMVDKLNKQRPSLSYNTECCSWSANDLDGSSLIQLLLQTHREAVYVIDSDGLTPVLRAAIQSQLRAIETILNECPESSEVCDPEGKTILHLLPIQSYEEAKICLKISQISALKDQQDKFGNTPSHLAVMNCKEKIIMQEKEQEKKMLLIEEKNNESIEDRKVFVEERKVFIEDQHIGMIRALLESFANFTIKNKKGHSAAALFQSLIPYFPRYNNGTLFELDIEIKEMLTKNKEMMLLAPKESISTSKDDHRKIWEAVEHSNLDLLRKEVKVLESWLSNGLLRIGDLLKILLQECNNNNSKATHEISYDEVEQFMIQLLEHNPVLLCQTNLRGDTFLHTMARDEHYEMSESFSSQIYKLGYKTKRCFCPPWKIMNVEGNTPLHEALMNAPKQKIVKFLLTCDNDVATYVNNKTETPLHVLCRAKGKEIDEDVITMIIEANIQVTYHRDSEGLTPLLKAAKEGKIGIVIKICQLSSNSAQLRDHSGKTFWHLMNMTDATDKNEEDLQKIHENNKELEDLITVKDVYGNSSLRSAIVNKHSKLAEFLVNVDSSANKRVYRNLQKEDRDMQYHLFLLKFASWLPERLERTLMRKFDEVGTKSIFGVPEESIKDYINTIGVIAVLTATVAIEAAFQPPNQGLHLEDPIIIRAAYWIFMVSNIITGSFISAMISVMTGVFSLNYKNTPRLAIFAVVICSSTLLVLHKFIVMNFLQFVFLSGYLVYEIFSTAISGLCRRDDKKIGNKDNK